MARCTGRALAVGFAASIGVPVLLARWMFPGRGERLTTVLVTAATVGAVALLGLSLGSLR